MRKPAALALAVFLAFAVPAASFAQSSPIAYATPAFTDGERLARVQAVLPAVDKMYTELAEKEHLPGLVYGVMLDGKLIHMRTAGLANVERKLPVSGATQFRIASMSKSFVAMAALKLRDHGKLRLDDPVSKYLPELRKVRMPTTDAPVLTVRHLMTMTAGLPEDNPWGDRQMALSNAELEKLIGAGLSFSTSPGQSFEYSNLGFVMLGKVVSKAAGMRFQDYVSKQILQPLGMNSSGWEYAKVPADKLALGYRWTGSGWELEPMLHDGDAAAMGGMLTSMDDFSRYVAFLLDAWPARDGADNGPVRRSSAREMQLPQAFAGLAANTTLVGGKTLNPKVSFYGYGLSWGRDSRDVVIVGHSGGLPGFGSQFRFAPDHGVAVIAFTNLRYGQVYGPTNKALNMLIEDAKLPPRSITPSAILLRRKEQVAEMIQSWEPGLSARITADNFFLDRSQADWVTLSREQLAKLGKIVSIGPIKAENQLRGSFLVVGETGSVCVRFTLTPDREPKVQELEFKPAKKM